MTPRASGHTPAPDLPTPASMFREAAAFVRSAFEPEPTVIPGPRGDGHAVLFFPAVMRGDGQTAGVRNFLAANGYRAFGWDLGVNLGPVPWLLSGATARLAGLAADHGPVSLVGYSMGGLFARWLARRMPQYVRQVITVCAPFNDALHSTWFPLEAVSRFWPGPDLSVLAAEVAKPLAVPGTFIYCRSDGIVDWRCCLDEQAATGDNIEVTGHHTTMAGNPEVRRILLDRLAPRPR